MICDFEEQNEFYKQFYDIPLTFVDMKQNNPFNECRYIAPTATKKKKTFDRYFVNPAHFTSKQLLNIVSVLCVRTFMQNFTCKKWICDITISH